MAITFQGQEFVSIRELILDVFSRVSITFGSNQYDSLLTTYQDANQAFDHVDETSEEEDIMDAEKWKVNSQLGIQLAEEFIIFIQQFTEYVEALKFYYNLDEDEYEHGLYNRIKAIRNDRSVMKSLCQLSDLVRFHNVDITSPE
jgi:hypothetical protein